jgi:S-adenosylmethionine decarboxylase
MTSSPVDIDTTQEPFGYELQLDLYGCNLDIIKDKSRLKEFVVGEDGEGGIIKLIGMVKYGEFECPHFGHTSPKTSGYSFKQWIETSLISGHFSEARGTAYINVFSCMKFDPVLVEDFAILFFRAKDKRSHFVTRW